MARPRRASRRPARARPPTWWPGMLLLVALVTSACGSSLLGSATTTPSPAADSVATSTTTTLAGEVAVAFPVVACTTASGAPSSGHGWTASVLLAPIPTALVGRIEFYSDGTHSVLGPNGWSCTESTASDGGADLSVVPTGSPPPASNGTAPGAPAPGTEGVFATFDSTGRPAGAGIVCPYFTIPQWQQREANCNGQRPQGEFSNLPTPDVASVLDPPGVTGSLPGSGGTRAVTGTVIFPQVTPAVSEGASIDVAMESCSLIESALCPTVLADFDVRDFPVPSTTSGYG